ncbi:pentatricopeptide repeat-containing protein At4g13650-like [Tasmannia lanceolata]|uniref:pentatricopeptide repeat-containing protein At4g13650-like n=1 Tax=Tasmannia lanceolata TaxID=3420 RepID=UPI0040641DDC
MLVSRFANGGKSILGQDRALDVLGWNQILQYSFGKGLYEQVLFLFHRMRDSGLHPNASTFPSVIGSCTKLSTPQFGEKIHAFTIRYGCDSDQYVCSSLVHMYAKSQHMDDALQLFERMPQRSVVSWTTLIQGYARLGSFNEAVEMFEIMQRDGIRPNAVTILSVIPACLRLRDGESLHAYVVKLGLESDSLVATSIADMYMKFRAAGNATQVFHGLRDKNKITWLVMVSGLAHNGFIGDAVSLVCRILWDFDLILDSTALVTLVSACTDTGVIEYGKWIHMYTIKVGVELDVYIGTALLNMYAKFGDLEFSHRMFERLLEPNLVSWNAILHSYARQGFLEEFMQLFRRLNQTGLYLDSATIRNCILALVSSSNYRRESQLGECFHGLAIKHGFFDSEIATANAILDFYAKTGNLESAKELFLCTKDRRDVISWNCLMNAYVNGGFGEEAIKLFYQMQLACIVPDSFTISNVLAASACSGLLSFGQCMHAYLIRQGYSYCVIWDSFIGTSLVNMYGKCGQVKSAYMVFEETQFKDTATWNAMVAGFSQNGYTSEALALFYSHLKSMGGSFVFDSAVAIAISACSQSGCLDVGKSLHCYILRKGLEGDSKVSNAILSMYSKCGVVEDAKLFFEGMSEKDTTSWTAMIAGYAMNGRVNGALSLFEEMTKEKDVEPNQVTFLEVLWACSHGGLLKEGWGYFERMRRVYKIKARADHYCCVVDLLGRSGHLYEAYALIRSMEVRADAAVWGALVGACRIHGELELGQIAGEELLRAEETNNGYHVLLSNVYAVVGWWECAARVRKEVKVQGHTWNKSPGWSRIEVRN